MSVVINGSAGVTTNSGAVYNGISSGTAVASTSGTSIDFTSIPSWVKRITVMFNGVSTSGTSNLQIQIGDSGGVETTSYNSATSQLNTSGMSTSAAITTGYSLTFSTLLASSVCSGSFVLKNISGNSWIGDGLLSRGDGCIFVSAGTKATSDTLDRVRITTVNGTDTFDAGSINILYE